MAHTLNYRAMTIPAEDLVNVLEERIRTKAEELSERDRSYGKNRIRISSYMENLGWPGLFGYDMNRVFNDPDFAFEMELRQRLFWADNSLDDSMPDLRVGATAGVYFDMTLFGLSITHTSDGVPCFASHPLGECADLSLLKPFDFRTTGAMPGLIEQYDRMRVISADLYGGKLDIGFPSFGRGPLDICITLRGYDRFVIDAVERPAFVHELLGFIVNERRRWNRERRSFLGEPAPDRQTTAISDDWVNAPFISPELFNDFVLPAYREICRGEGDVTGFHTCGNLEPFVLQLLETFPGIRNLDVGGWNDMQLLDRLIDPSIRFSLSLVNTFVLKGTDEEHRRLLNDIAAVAESRSVSVCVQAIVKMHPTYDETLHRMNRFIKTARDIFANAASKN